MPKDVTKPKRATVEKNEKPSKTKSKKSGPRRAVVAYIFFCQDWRDRVKVENPDARFGELGKLLGAKWKEMTEPEKKPYNEMAAQDKLRAEREKIEWKEKQKDANEEDDAA